MFYSQFILAKKGPLGTIWIAAHLERKLRKNQVADTDIGVSVDSILCPEVPIALRLSSHLLLGVVRIYSRKVGYLFDDCSEALLKVKQAFRSAAVDLPPEESKAPYHSITLPETFDLDDFELPDNDIFQGNFVDHHVSAKEQITLQDTMGGVVYSTSQFGLDERFGDGDASQIGLDLDEELLLNEGMPSGSRVLLTSCVEPQPQAEPSSSRMGGELDEQMQEASQTAANDCSTEAPLTPRLVESSGLPSTREAQVSDDRMEEDHNPVSESTYIVDKSSVEDVKETEEELHINSSSEKREDPDFIIHEASEVSNAAAKTDMLSVCKPILQPCNFHNNEGYAELDNVVGVPDMPPKDSGVGLEGISRRENAPDVTGANVQDVTSLNLNEDKFLDAAPCNRSDGQPVNPENGHYEMGNDSITSELPSPEKMLSLPCVAISQSKLFVGPTPEGEVHAQDDEDATTTKISGKKRSLTESTITLQSLNSVESSEAAQSKRSVDFVPDDDDLLSSILVGKRSTMFKVKSTPPALNLVSSKRPRVTPRSGAHKRKVVMDESTVLHGDAIRQQLVNTEDVRRVRKKAPSTRPEIWILQKLFLEDEMFNEPILTGMLSELISLHCQPYDLSKTRLVQDHETKAQCIPVDVIGSPIRPTVGEGIEFERNSVTSFARHESASADYAHDIPTQPIQASIRISSDEGGDTLENERPTDVEVGHPASQLDGIGKTGMETECSREPIVDETDHSLAFRVEMLSSLPVNGENSVAEDRTNDEGRLHMPGIVNQDGLPESESQYDDMCGLFLDHQRENSKADFSNPVEDLGLENAMFTEGVTLEENQLAESQIFIDTNTASNYNTVGNISEPEADAFEHDTGFLNFDDDDELAEGDENSTLNAEGPQILDNSGWSSRTRAVANYLQGLFQKEAQRGKKALHLDNLLANKSRKEASRMFFETLVLKTRDYIRVEQENPFGDIGVKPRATLLKSGF